MAEAVAMIIAKALRTGFAVALVGAAATVAAQMRSLAAGYGRFAGRPSKFAGSKSIKWRR